jgi:DNA-binding transcriptional MerR regulator
MADELLLIADVSRALDGALSPDGVRAASDRGDLPVAQRTPSGVRLFRRSDVERFRQARKERHGKAK